MVHNRVQERKNDIYIRIIIGTLFILLVFTGAFFILQFMDNRLDYSTINHIKSMQRGPNDFIDVGDTIGIHSPNDIGFMMEEDNDITVYYGKLVIKVPQRGLKDPEYVNALASIGLEVINKAKEGEDPDYSVTYWGHEIYKWVKRY